MTPSLADLRALEQAATPSPWFAGDGEANEDVNVWDSSGVPARAIAHDVFNDTDRALIAEARNALPSLLDRVAAAEAERDALRESVVCLHAALEEVLTVAERIRGGDASLDPEEWYAARDYGRRTLKKRAVLAAPVPPGPAVGGDA